MWGAFTLEKIALLQESADDYSDGHVANEHSADEHPDNVQKIKTMKTMKTMPLNL